MRIPAITAALAAVLLCTALAPQAQAANVMRRCVKGSGSGVNTDRIAALRHASTAATAQIARYLRNGYKIDPVSVNISCRLGQIGSASYAVFYCNYSLLACKYR